MVLVALAYTTRYRWAFGDVHPVSAAIMHTGFVSTDKHRVRCAFGTLIAFSSQQIPFVPEADQLIRIEETVRRMAHVLTCPVYVVWAEEAAAYHSEVATFRYRPFEAITELGSKKAS